MSIAKQIKQAEQLAEEGKLDKAIAILRDGVLEKFPQQPQAQALLGLLYLYKKDFQLAEHHLLASIDVVFNIGVAKNLTMLYVQCKRWQDAYPWSEKLVEKLPLDIDIQLNHALILRHTNQVEGALEIYKKIVKGNPKHSNTYVSYGFTLNQLERYEEAVDIYKQGLNIRPYEFNLLYNIGITYLNQYDYDNSLKYLTLALEQNKQSIDLWLTIATCQAKKRNIDAAFNSIQEARKLDPNNPLVPFQEGILLMDQDKDKEAMQCLVQVVEIEPNHIEANYHKGIIFLKEEKYMQASLYYRYRVKRIHHRYGKFNDFELPKVNKESELIISWEQGIGDEILHLGLIKNIQRNVKSITYITQDKLYDWVSHNLNNIDVIKESEYKLHIIDNPNLIQLNIGSLFAYIHDWDHQFETPAVWTVDPNLRKKYLHKYKKDNQKILGLSWKSANKKIGDEKSIPLCQLTSIISNQKTISLQYGDVIDEINITNQRNDVNIIHDDELDYFNDIHSLAALISICDIVVTCSNVTAHIAGRLGIRTYLMTPKFFSNIWYWNQSGNQSKWYPSVTIIKQNEDMSWDDPIQEVKKELNHH